MIICILKKGALGMLLFLNSQEEQIILDHVSHIDHSQLKPEQMTIIPGNAPWSCLPVPPEALILFWF